MEKIIEFVEQHFTSVLAGVFAFVVLILCCCFMECSDSEFLVDENIELTSSEYIFGIDVSHHQGVIDWSEVEESDHRIHYVFVKATESSDFKDTQFHRNWEALKESSFVRGAYHFYRPNVNSALQFQNYSDYVDLDVGDFVPILDVEVLGNLGEENLVKGVLNWLRLAEKKYGVKPLIYTGRSFYDSYLKGYIEEYPLWIAAYSGKHRLSGVDWDFHQFTEEVRVRGIRALVDGNDFNGTLVDLKSMCLD